jgi:geranyl diphosphate 2-C-methyltransferase
METRADDQVLTSAYQRDLAAYWNNKTDDPVNLRLGAVDGLYHHHYGLGDYDPAVLAAPEEERDERIIRELHRLETAQAEVLLDQLGDVGDVGPGDRLLDAGCGRGGTSFMANERFGCTVDGVTISEYQVGFAREQAALRGRQRQVRFHFRNMLDTGFPSGSYRAVWTNETTMYVDLSDLFGEFARLLQPGGRYVCITGCANDARGERSASVAAIDEHYICNIHPRSAYFRALAEHGLVPIRVLDLTPRTTPYWELRAQSPVRTGIEEAFLTAYCEGSFQYLLIVADRI